MNDYISKITLDLNCNKNIQTVRAGQFDVGRRIEITVTADGESFDVSGSTAVLKICKSDKSGDAISCDIADNKIIATLNKNTLSVRGLSVAKITISDSLKTFSTQAFIIDVDSSLESDITAADKYSILNDLIQQVHLITEQGGIIIDNYPSLSSTNPIANNILTALLNNKADKSALDDKQNTLVLDDTPTLGSTNFVNSDRIAAALSYKANSKDLSKKAYKTDVDSALDLKADKTYVDAALDTKEDVSNKVNTIDSAITDVNKYPTVIAIINHLSEFFYNFEEIDEQMITKADKATTLDGYGITENLLAIANTSTNFNGIDVVVKDNHISISGTATANGALLIPCKSLELDSNKSYCFSVQNYEGTTTGVTFSLGFDNTAIADSALSANTNTNIILSGTNYKINTIRLYFAKDRVVQKDFNAQLIVGTQVKDFVAPSVLCKPIGSGEVTQNNLSTDVINTINDKYNSDNVETGSGTFTVVSDDIKPFIKSAAFQYQKVGKSLTLFGSVQFNEGVLPSNGYFQLSGIPFKAIENSRIVSSTSKYVNVTITVIKGNWISFNPVTSLPRVQDEILQFSINYLIN